jgi:hypothetical protein
MGKSHYKYIEIQQRAEHFMKVFMKHFELYETLFPIEVGLNEDFQEYLSECILKRRKPTDVHRNHPSIGFRKARTREAIIGKELLKLRSSDNAHEQYFYHLIMTFDRWNNYRILPMAFQEPHAFKRRQKNRHRKIIELTTKVPKEILASLEEDYSLGKVPAKNENSESVYFTYLCKSLRDGNFKYIKVKKTPECVDAFTQQKIYVFKNSEDCAAFITAAHEYLIDRRDKVKSGLRFWPMFRILIKKAVNFNQMERVTPERIEYISSSNNKNARTMEIRRDRKAKERIKKIAVSNR